MANRYALVDENGSVLNAVVWDGETEWGPSEGLTAVLHEEAGPGGTLIDGVYTPPPEDEGPSS